MRSRSVIRPRGCGAARGFVRRGLGDQDRVREPTGQFPAGWSERGDKQTVINLVCNLVDESGGDQFGGGGRVRQTGTMRGQEDELDGMQLGGRSAHGGACDGDGAGNDRAAREVTNAKT